MKQKHTTSKPLFPTLAILPTEEKCPRVEGQPPDLSPSTHADQGKIDRLGEFRVSQAPMGAG